MALIPLRTPPVGALPPVRFERLNTLRAFAILGVFLYHSITATFNGSVEHMMKAAQGWTGWAHTVAVMGFLCFSAAYQLVSIFFIMSGYFMYRAYLRWRLRNPGDTLGSFNRYFIWRRFWRLVPPFWVALLFAYFLAYDHPFSSLALRRLAINATLLKTLYPGYFFSINFSHWYVAVQWQLDLLFPLFLYLLARSSFREIFTLAIILGLTFNFVLPAFTNSALILYFPFRWWGDWALGALLAQCHSAGRRTFPWPLPIAVGAAAAIGLAYTLNFSSLAWIGFRVAMALLIEVTVLSRSPTFSWERWLAPIGLCSYSIYLFHLPLIDLWVSGVRSLGYEPRHASVWWISTPLCAVAVFAICLPLYYLIEEPSAALGSRLWRRLTLSRPQVTSTGAARPEKAI